MADRERNHHIPRFLLKRFASRQMDGKSWIFQIDKSGKIAEPSTRHVAVASYFYGDPGTGVEDMLGEEERAFSEILKTITDGADPNSLAQDLQKHLWQMIIRTKAIRDQFADAGAELFSQVIESIDSPDITAALTVYARENYNSIIETEIEKLPLARQSTARAFMTMPAVKEAAIKNIAREMPRNMAFLKQALSESKLGKLLDSVKDGQIKGIKKVLTETIVPETFRPKSWFLIRSNSEDIILGDVCAFGRDQTGKCGPFIQFGEKWDQLYLPISRNEVLAASNSDAPIFMHPSDINIISARLSVRYIYSAVNTPNTQALAPMIGIDAKIISTNEISAIVSEGMNGLIANPSRFIEQNAKA
ncbi:MAG: DUF4238 domain-containing protein [Ferrovibrio sp.]